MRLPLLVAALLLTAFAGCVGSGSGDTASGAASSLDGEAAAWSEDAILVALVGIESNDVEAMQQELDGDDGRFASLLVNDTTVGDGRAGAWLGAYISPSTGKVLLLVAGPDGVERIGEEDATTGGFPEAMLDMMAEAREGWSLDSPEAIAAVRAANATVDSALAAGGDSSVQYALYLFPAGMGQSGAWGISGQAGNLSFSASVDYESGAVSELEVEVGVMVPRPGGINVKPPMPKGPPPAPIHATGTTSASLDPLNVAQMPPCSTPTHQCEEIPFELNATYGIEATLAWGVAANDYDFYVLDSTGGIVLTGASPPGAVGPEEVSGTLEAGSYVIQVVPWSAAADTWTLDATFS